MRSAVAVESKLSDRLQEAPLKLDGTRQELQGRQRLTYAAELKVKILANKAIVMMKGFPGFCEWWFEELGEDRRQYIHQKLQMAMLAEFNRLSGLTEQKAEAMRDCIIRFFDRLPGFEAWNKVTLGADLRGRVHYQLKDYLWKEMRGAYR